MKKTARIKRNKLTLRLETVRTLTNQDLTLVVGGVCKHGTNGSVTQPPDGLVARIRNTQPTC